MLFSWFKHNKMLFSKGKMHEDRIAKFKQLFGEAKELQRINKDIINADNRKGFHIRARQRNWFEMCERYSKYLDDNKKFLSKMVTGNCTVGCSGRKGTWQKVT